jgi:hypothetical protein
LIRSELPPPEEPGGSGSPPRPGSLPKPPTDGMVGGSAGRATGRPVLKELAGFGAGATATRAAGLLAAFRVLALGAALFRLAALAFAVVRLAAVFFLPPARFVVLRLAVVRLAVDFLAPDRFAVDRFAVAFFLVEDFFFAGIFPPCGCATQTRAGFMRMRTRGCYLRFIASALRKDKHFPGVIAHQ